MKKFYRKLIQSSVEYRINKHQRNGETFNKDKILKEWKFTLSFIITNRLLEEHQINQNSAWKNYYHILLVLSHFGIFWLSDCSWIITSIIRMKRNIFFLLTLMFLSCEEDPIFGLERGWLRNDDSNIKQEDSESENDEDSGGNDEDGDIGGGDDTSNVDYNITIEIPNGGQSWETSNIQNIQWETSAPQSYFVGILSALFAVALNIIELLVAAVMATNNLIIKENGLVNTPIISIGKIIILITFGTLGVQKICFQ